MFKQQAQNKPDEEKTQKNEAEKADLEQNNKDEEESGEESQPCQASSENSAQMQAENGSGQNTEPTPEEKIAELEAQIAEIRDQLLRKAADFENFRKRMNQEKQNAIEYANQSLLMDIIPLIDNLERAIQAGESSTDYAAFLDGVKMIEKQLTTQLESKWGLKRFNSTGEPFDPNRHEALMMEKSSDVSEPVVQEDLFKGYLLKERVIRAAKVKVLMPEEQGQSS
jgi:molecular chaperone GrpE